MSKKLTKAIKDLAPGTPSPDGSVDYSHLLTPLHRAAGYSLSLGPTESLYNGSKEKAFKISLNHKGNNVGHVIGEPFEENSITPHSKILKEHRGKGLALPMYEALYHTAFKNGFDKIWGGEHSPDAAKVHQNLAAKHGLEYNPTPGSDDGMEWKGGYQYAIKSELAKGETLGPKVAHEQPISVPYVHRRGTIPTANYGERFNQHLEPAGKYIAEHTSPEYMPASYGNPKDWQGATYFEYGTAHFKKPWVHKMAEGESPLEWKKTLSAVNGSLVGKPLSNHLRKQGYDGIIAVHPAGHISEMVNLGAPETIHQPMPIEAPVTRTKKSEDGLAKGSMQRLAPFNPEEAKKAPAGDRYSPITGQVTPQTIGDRHGQWAGGGNNARDVLAEFGMSPEAKMRSLHKLHGHTDVRRNKKGEREFLLHRGVGSEEARLAHRVNYVNSDASGWTPHPHVAQRFVAPGGRTVSAWFPESSIKFDAKQHGSFNGKPGPSEHAGEYEIIVAPGKYALHKPVTLPGVKKSELAKMAIAAIPPGKPSKQKASEPNFSRFDYSHVLTPLQRAAGYRMHVEHGRIYSKAPLEIKAVLTHPQEPGSAKSSPGSMNTPKGQAGVVQGLVQPNEFGTQDLNIANALMGESHRGKGLGLAGYEAIMAHSKHYLGATHVSQEDTHSTSAHGAHQALARKHGLQYRAKLLAPSRKEGEYDARFGPYRYAIKSEAGVTDLKKEEGDDYEDETLGPKDIAALKRMYDRNPANTGFIKGFINSPKIPDSFLRDIAQSVSTAPNRVHASQIRRMIAQHPNASPVTKDFANKLQTAADIKTYQNDPWGPDVPDLLKEGSLQFLQHVLNSPEYENMQSRNKTEFHDSMLSNPNISEVEPGTVPKLPSYQEHQNQLHEMATHPAMSRWERKWIGTSPHTAGRTLTHLAQNADPGFDTIDMHPLAQNPHTPAEGLTALASKGDRELHRVILKHPNVDENTIREINNVDDMEGPISTIHHPKTPGDVVHSIFESRPLYSSKESVAAHMANHPNVTPETLQGIIDTRNKEEFDPKTTAYIQQKLDQVKANRPGYSIYSIPNSNYQKVQVKPNLQKLRQVRDQILSSGKTEAHPKELPQGDWSMGRNARGNIEAAKLQQHIDAQPSTEYGVTHTKWTGAQRHNKENSKVFQLNMQPEMRQKLEDAGVGETFDKIHDASHQSGHPVKDNTLGWVRYTEHPGTEGKPHQVFIDEIQSDLGQSFSKQLSAQARQHAEQEAQAQGLEGPAREAHLQHWEQVAREKAQEFPDTHHQAISNIVFGGRKANEVIGNAFLQHLRDTGRHDAQIQIHSVQSKAPISLGKPVSKEHPAPGHMQHTYDQLPKSWGFKPAQYGQLQGQDNPDMQGQSTHQGEVRKAETIILHRGTQKPEGLPNFPAWFTTEAKDASDYGPNISSFQLSGSPKLLPVSDYGGALAKLGVKKYKNASRDLLTAATAAGFDGYHYQNPMLSSQEIALAQPHLHLTHKMQKKELAKEEQNNKAWEPPRPDDYDSGSDHMRDTTFYHGTPHQFTDFEHKPGFNSSTLAENPEKVQRHGFFFSSNPKFAAGFTGDKGRVIQAKLIHGSHLRLDHGIPETIVHHFEDQGLTDTWKFTPGSGGNRSPWQLFDGEYGRRAVQAMKNAGYDSASFGEEDPQTNETGRTHVVFHPSQILQHGKNLPLAKEEPEAQAQVVGAPPKKARKPRAKAKPKAEEHNLVGIHNLTAANLGHVDELGGNLVAPSLAITHKDHPLTGFGDISLVAPHHLIDPERVPVFNADVYSPRHPRAKFKVHEGKLRAFKDWIRPHAKATDSYIEDLESEINKEGSEAALNRTQKALGAAYLKEKGVELPMPMRQEEERYPWLKAPSMEAIKTKYPRNHLIAEPHEMREWSEAAKQAIPEYAAQQFGNDEHRKKLFQVNHMIDLFGTDSPEPDETPRWNQIEKAHEFLHNPTDTTPKPDTRAYGNMVSNIVDNDDNFKTWAQNKTKDLVHDRYLPKYIDTANGPTERKLPYTPESILKEMTKTIRGGESFNYGLGSARAQGAKQFKNMAEMAKARGQIMPSEEFGKHKEALQNQFNELASNLDKLDPNDKYTYKDTALLNAIQESYRRGRSLSSELRANGISANPRQLQAIEAFKKELVESPTEYFESKPQRIVHLSEFPGAAVPKRLAPEHRALLNKHGIQHLEDYDPAIEGDRARAINRIAQAQKLHLAELPMAKSEEISRALQHPEAVERRLALKLHGVSEDNLIQALHDKDPEVQEAAFRHPGFNHNGIRTILQLADSPELQLKALEHPLTTQEDVKELYRQNGHPAVTAAITARKDLDPEFIHELYSDGNAHKDHLDRALPQTIQAILEHHFNSPEAQAHPGHRELAKEALKHPHAGPEFIEQAFKGPDHEFQMLAAHSPKLSNASIMDVLKPGQIQMGQNAPLRLALMMSPSATEEHLKQGLKDTDPQVQSEARLALHAKSFKKYEQDLGLFLQKSGLEPLVKNNEEHERNEICSRMLGHRPELHHALEAAHALFGGVRPDPVQIKRALWEANGHHQKAALLAHHVEPSKENLKALDSVKEFMLKKNLEAMPQAKSVVASNPDGLHFAEAIERAYRDQYVFPIDLAGKHSAGSMVARDPENDQSYLLKSDSGHLSAAIGLSEQKASQVQREAAFWAVANAWGLAEYFPECHALVIDGKEFAAMRLVPWRFVSLEKVNNEHPGIERRILEPFRDSGVLFKWAILDFALGQTDRHLNNILVDSQANPGQASVKLIDEGSTFAGADFAPGVDRMTFCPAYLRAWAPKGFNQMSPEDKLRAMPKGSSQALNEVVNWLDNLPIATLEQLLKPYGLDAQPILDRLAKLKMYLSTDLIDKAIERLWVGI